MAFSRRVLCGCCTALMALVVAVVLSIPTAPHSATRPWPEDPDYIAEEPQPKAERRSALRAQGCSTPSAGDTGVASGPRAKVSDAELQRRYGGGKWHIYRLPADSGAVCLDGSPGAFYVHLAPNSSGWLIFFEGGGWCHHQGPCGNRRPGAKLSGLGTSKDMTATAALPQAKGILNRQTSPFRHYNMVFWKYCDASSYTGHNTIPVSIGGYAFRFQGSRILQTGIEHLRCVFGLDRASDVLLVGHSAGGMGVMLNLHHWRQAIPQSIPVYAVMDGGFFLDIQSYEEGREESRRYAAGLRYWNATAVLDPKCMRHYEPLGAPWKCLLPHYYLPFVPPEVPLFVSQSKYDIHALKVFVGAKKGKYNASEDFRRISHIGDTFTSVFSERRPSGLFLPACSQAFAKHSMVTDDSFCDVYKIDGVTLCQAIAQWHKSKGQQQVALQDKCRHPCDGGKPGVCTQRAFN